MPRNQFTQELTLPPALGRWRMPRAQARCRRLRGYSSSVLALPDVLMRKPLFAIVVPQRRVRPVRLASAAGPNGRAEWSGYCGTWMWNSGSREGRCWKGFSHQRRPARYDAQLQAVRVAHDPQPAHRRWPRDRSGMAEASSTRGSSRAWRILILAGRLSSARNPIATLFPSRTFDIYTRTRFASHSSAHQKTGGTARQRGTRDVKMSACRWT